MYQGKLFPKWMDYANSLNPDAIFILSGKYGLLNLDDSIEPYDVNLNTKSKIEILEWSNKVLVKLRNKFDLKKDKFVIITNQTYRFEKR